MSILSESITIGLLLALVFGALFFYLYSRIAYTEKRISLMENILLDIKMNQEQMPMHFIPHIPPNINFHDISRVPIVVNRPIHSEPEPHKETILESLDKPVIIDPVSEEIYTEALNNAHNEALKEETPVVAPTKLSVNYESMTKEELVEVAKKRGLRTGNKPGREKLLQLIRKSESTHPEGTSSFDTLQEAVELDA
jgi:hypothetical protein